MPLPTPPTRNPSAAAGRAASPAGWALLLGYAGLIPFVAAAMALWLLPEGSTGSALAGPALSGYAAVIVSFLGGIHWGVALRQPAPPAGLLAWGVVPSLVAWVALLLPLPWALALLGAMLLLCWAVDWAVYPRYALTRWLPLRLRLSAVAALSCFVGAAGALRG
jgi:hypothetical protein